MKKIISLITTLLLVFCLFGCGGPKPEETVDKYLGALKNLDFAVANETLLNPSDLDFDEDLEDEDAQYLIDVFKKYSNEIKYEITNVETEDDEAKVTVDFEYVDAYEVGAAAVKEIFGKIFTMAFAGTHLTEEEMTTIITEAFDKAMQENKTNMVNSTETFDLVKTDDGWKISSLPENLINIATSNLMKPFSELSEEFDD